MPHPPTTVDLSATVPSPVQDFRSLPITAALLIAAESVDSASWIVWTRKLISPVTVRAANVLVKTARTIAMSPHSLARRDRFLSVVKASQDRAFVAESESDPSGVPWLESISHLGGMIRSVCDPQPWDSEQYERIHLRVVTLLEMIVEKVRTLIPSEDDEQWAGRLRLAIAELNCLVNYTAEKERKYSLALPLDSTAKKMIRRAFVDTLASEEKHKKRGLRESGDRGTVENTIRQKPSNSHLAERQELSQIERDVNDLIGKERVRFSKLLERFAGASFETFEEKKETVDRLKRMASLFGLQLLYRGLPVGLQLGGPAPAGGTGSILVLQKRKLLYAKTTFPELTCELSQVRKELKATKPERKKA